MKFGIDPIDIVRELEGDTKTIKYSQYYQFGHQLGRGGHPLLRLGSPMQIRRIPKGITTGNKIIIKSQNL